MTNACPPDRLAHVAVNTILCFFYSICVYLSFCILHVFYYSVSGLIQYTYIHIYGVYSEWIAISLCMDLPARWEPRISSRRGTT